MNKRLAVISRDFTDMMQSNVGVLGAWNFGSVSRDMSDEYSDADIVFLVDGEQFKEIADKIEPLLAKTCDKVLFCWDEEFNGDSIINNGYLIQKDSAIFQFDVFLINNDRIDDFICKIHYTNLAEKDILFDKTGSVKALCGSCPKGSLWSGDINGLFRTYLYHFYMTAKYIVRKDYFKLNYVMRTLFDTHASLLLTSYDRINWGGEGNKLTFIPTDKQEHLKKYYCCGDFTVNKVNLREEIDFFEADIKESTLKFASEVCLNNLTLIKKYWEQITQ